MTTFSQIESAARGLSAEEKQRLLVSLAESLRAEGRSLPAPRRFTSAEIETWIEDDERDMELYRQGS
ncbi:MAG TPA: hypothetical protein VLA73_11175 [Burkholderiales bacterium]|nr:hypothetical protein [Burkholderiales bacterium]